METVRSKDNTPIAYERSGKGPALVLVHGTTADHTRWAPLLPELGRHFTVYAVDRRGRGQSGDSDSYSLEREFEDVAAVVDAAGRQVNLLGHSYGALCAMEAALRTSHLRKLVLYEPSFPAEGVEMYPPGAGEKLQALLDRGDRELLLTTYIRDIVHMPEQEIGVLRSEPAWQARLAAAHTLVREMADADYVFDSKRFRRLTAPTLLLLGEKSPPFLKRPTERLASVLPNSRVVVMPGQGHAAMSTAPELFLREVVTFLTE
ncbi:MAG: alpha/beta hydrolase [Chloroflexi bacterium]|nr:alpha/beta hydrolase [Chloroflexota bacterium]